MQERLLLSLFHYLDATQLCFSSSLSCLFVVCLFVCLLIVRTTFGCRLSHQLPQLRGSSFFKNGFLLQHHPDTDPDPDIMTNSIKDTTNAKTIDNTNTNARVVQQLFYYPAATNLNI